MHSLSTVTNSFYLFAILSILLSLSPSLLSLSLSLSFKIISQRSPPITFLVFRDSFYPTLSGHLLSLPIFNIPFFPHVWATSTYSSPVSSLVSCLLLLSALLTPTILHVQLFSQTCIFSCSFSVNVIVSKSYVYAG